MLGAEPPQVVLDASVAVRWLVDEAGSASARALLDENVSWLAPSLLLVELASALRRKAVEGEIEAAVAAKGLGAILIGVRTGNIRLVEDEALIQRAMELSLAVGHKVPDCVYLAPAEREGALLATADTALARLATASGISVRLVPSND
jgi:predicted nucleic acid-binding protein